MVAHTVHPEFIAVGAPLSCVYLLALVRGWCVMRGDDSVSDQDGLSDAADDYIYEDYIYDSDNGGGPS